MAGVANVLLKRDFEGVNVSARVGAATDGGDEQQQYDLVAGHIWQTGGILLAYDFERDTAIMARERSYAATTSSGLTLLPPLKHHNIVLTGHQDITDKLEFSIDAVYNRRWSNYTYAYTLAGDYLQDGLYSLSRNESFTVSPALALKVGRTWHAHVAATWGIDRTHYGSDEWIGGIPDFSVRACYCNTEKSAEAGVDGTLLSIPGGPVQLAFGGGIRSNTFRSLVDGAAERDIRATQDVRFAYGEINIPLVSPDLGIPFIHRLDVNGAVRYEDYPGIDTVVTPKFGVVYAPTPDLDLKASWGQSFKAPTLYQQHNVTFAEIRDASRLGSNDTAPATALLLSGGNPGLKPERANTWSTTLALHPRSLPGARLEVSYFNVDYRDRVVAPITYLTQSLSDPIYHSLVTANPTAAQQGAILQGANIFNETASSYDPATVVAIVDDRSLNVARQRIQGIDLSGSYTWLIDRWGTFKASASATYLDSSQKLSADQPNLDLSGTVFNPPHVRGRFGISWTKSGLTIASFGNYTGGVRDGRFVPNVHVGAMTTADLTARYHVDDAAALFRGIEVGLSINNAFNAKPSTIRTLAVEDAPFDSTNYSPVGRFVSLSISKSF